MTKDRATDEALDWTIRINQPDFDAWEELTAWLAADPDNAALFDRLTVRDDDVVRRISETEIAAAATPPVSAREMGRSRRPVPFGVRTFLPIAASIALVAGLGVTGMVVWRPKPGVAPSVMALQTRPGERRDLRLSDGTRVAMAGGTKLLIDVAAHHAELDEGRATFSVVHDPQRQFTVRLGTANIVDIGTIFDLRRQGDRNVVAVAEGEVRVDRPGGGLEMSAGRQLRFGDQGAAELDDIMPDAVAGWQSGRFRYADGTVADVVADIVQSTGAQIRVTPQAAARRFAGTIVLSGDASQDLRKVAALLGLSVVRDGQVWVLSPAHSPA